mmetsp:Transcript_27745/g.79486  ORF Transcript_27745/g.79486 Transcript_27745/m.79486 type:complete len:306 (-) Transcript_27745:823-1740(-)
MRWRRRRRPVLVAHRLQPPIRIAQRRFVLEPTIRIFLHKQIRQGPELTQDACRMLRIGFVDQTSGFLAMRERIQLLDESQALRLQLGLSDAHVLHGVGVLHLRHVEHVAVCPIRALPTQLVRVRSAVWGRHGRCCCRQGHEDRRGRGVRPEPKHRALAPRPRLHDVRRGRSEEADRAFPTALHGLAGSCPAIWVAPGASSQVFRHVVPRALVVVAVDAEQGAHFHGRGGLRGDRVDRLHAQVRVALNQPDDAEKPIGAPNAPTAVELVLVLAIAVGLREVQRLPGTPPAPLPGDAPHGVAEQEVV